VIVGGKTMRTIAIAATLALAVAMPNLAAAQGNRAHAGTAGPGSPVGHRQPSAKDVPPEPGTPPVEVTKQDRALERALKGICRGC
jgi:hypothetical protein